MIPRLFIWLLLFLPLVAQGQDFGVMTYNLRFDNPGDGENSWPHRKAEVAKLVGTYHPAFLGTQEGLLHQVAFLDSVLTEYQYIGVGRDDGVQGGEYCALFFDTTRYTLLESSTFWLSETPEKPTKGWDSDYYRICTYGLFREKQTGANLWVLNTHFDHVAVLARRHSAEMLSEKITELIARQDVPVILLGDFNAVSDSEPIQILQERMTDAAGITETPMTGPHGTFTGYDAKTTPERRIDYVFVHHLGVRSLAHLDQMREDGGFLSDHLPVYAVLFPLQ